MWQCSMNQQFYPLVKSYPHQGVKQSLSPSPTPPIPTMVEDRKQSKFMFSYRPTDITLG